MTWIPAVCDSSPVGMGGAISSGMNAATNNASYTILDTHAVKNPMRSARLMGAFLAEQKGYSSRIVEVRRGIVDMVASDNRAIRFTHALRSL